jgi:hypothetical protein
MFVALRMITLPPEGLSEREALVAELRRAAGELANVRSSWIAPVADGVGINAGHVVWRMTFESEAAAAAVRLQPAWRSQVVPLLNRGEVTGVGYRVTESSVRPSRGGVWRALVFRVWPHGFPAEARRLEAGLLLLPKYVPAIRSWALSPVASGEGPKAFTHVWEQEFDSLSGLTDDYMQHPIHWGYVDAWFDAECPQYIVDPQLIQVVGEIDETIMT